MREEKINFIDAVKIPIESIIHDLTFLRQVFACSDKCFFMSNINFYFILYPLNDFRKKYYLYLSLTGRGFESLSKRRNLYSPDTIERPIKKANYYFYIS
jgi:hypothetical protein